MGLTGEQWHLLANGAYPNPVNVFTVSPIISVRLGVSTTSVFIRPAYVQKIRFKHRVEPRCFEHLPAIASDGIVFADSEPNYVQIFGQIDEKLYRLILKGIPEINEIWISTFLRSHDRDFRKRTRGVLRIR